MGSESETLPELDAYDFALPPEAIAQQPPAERDAAKLLVVDRALAADTKPERRRIRDLPSLLRPEDLLVVNRTRVIAARLRGTKSSGGRAEALLLGTVEGDPGRHRALLATGGRLREGIELSFRAPDATSGKARGEAQARVVAVRGGGEVELAFEGGVSPYDFGEAPLPPYIRRSADDASDQRAIDQERYQTVFADSPGAVAAPTAGLHLTRELLATIEAVGVELASVVLHVGLGTFRPLRADDLAAGRLHAERFELPQATAEAVARARARGGRVVAVGTTTTRVLESRARDDGSVEPGAGETQLFIRPGDRFRAVDALLTNFHLPRSSLLMLVCAFGGRERILAAYAEALRAGYRFYSYGDAMWIA